MAGPRNAAWSAGSSLREMLTAVASEYERLQAENRDLQNTIRDLRKSTGGNDISTWSIDFNRPDECSKSGGNDNDLPGKPRIDTLVSATRPDTVNSIQICGQDYQVASKSAWADEAGARHHADTIRDKTSSRMPSTAMRSFSTTSKFSSEFGIASDGRASEHSAGFRVPIRRMATIRDSVTPMFPNQGDMKSIVKSHLDRVEKHYKVEHLYKETGWAQAVARHQCFENITLVVIAMNSIWIAIDTDYNNAEVLIDAHPVFMVFEQAFCFFFTGELLIRFLAFKVKKECLQDSWFVFDLTLVVLMIIESWVLVIFTFVLSFSRSGERRVSNVSILRMAKLLRIMRMLRISRLLRTMPEFFILMKALSAAFRAVFFTLAFLVIILYVFGICFTSVLKDTPIGDDKFFLVPVSMQRLFFQVALFDEVIDLVLELTEEKEWLALILLYVLSILAGITIMNMLIGVLCEAVTAVADSERTTLHVARVQATLQRIMSEDIDDDQDGLISKQEFAKMMKSNVAVRSLEEIGVDVVGLVDIADTIFANNAPGGKQQMYDKKLKFEEFMEVLLQLRGSNKATVKDIVELRKEVHRTMAKIEKLASNFQTLGNAVTASNNVMVGNSNSPSDLSMQIHNKKGSASSEMRPMLSLESDEV